MAAYCTLRCLWIFALQYSESFEIFLFKFVEYLGETITFLIVKSLLLGYLKHQLLDAVGKGRSEDRETPLIVSDNATQNRVLRGKVTRSGNDWHIFYYCASATN